ncbi:hypothetical protein [Jeotgalibacillus campisalis]|uniref:Uncharacterized protein n=1 Tax=Jeotgalibacillus campisalis TaxID=220754 RepID=A0A0C2W9W2_9BACL|nr:hypothetical protein [Jeotgalibacillus campisalis]KIL52843.1 hypothetical protein KR50_01720 [Jeotgalibacillus campisalis]
MRLKKKIKYVLYALVTGVLILLFNLFFQVPDHQTRSVKKYLETNVAWNNQGGVITDGYKIYGGKDGELYVWYTFEEWNREKQQIDSGASLPLVILLDEENKAAGHKRPADGASYEESVKDLFPFYVRARMNHDTAPASIRQMISAQQEKLPPEEEENTEE